MQAALEGSLEQVRCEVKPGTEKGKDMHRDPKLDYNALYSLPWVGELDTVRSTKLLRTVKVFARRFNFGFRRSTLIEKEVALPLHFRWSLILSILSIHYVLDG